MRMFIVDLLLLKGSVLVWFLINMLGEFFKDWVFIWNDSDDINNKKLFRNDVENVIDLNRTWDPKYVNFVLDKYKKFEK